MKALDIAFVDTKSVSPVGVALILVALGVLGCAFVKQWQLNQSVAEVDTQIRNIEQQHQQQSHIKVQQNKQSGRDVQKELAQAHSTANTLKFSWGKLLVALELAQVEDVVLLAVEPDDTSHLLKMTAEAKDSNAMFKYIAALQKSDYLKEVELVRHEVQTEDKNQPVRFDLEARFD